MNVCASPGYVSLDYETNILHSVKNKVIPLSMTCWRWWDMTHCSHRGAATPITPPWIHPILSNHTKSNVVKTIFACYLSPEELLSACFLQHSCKKHLTNIYQINRTKTRFRLQSSDNSVAIDTNKLHEVLAVRTKMIIKYFFYG